jgi:hypothetical protein
MKNYLTCVEVLYLPQESVEYNNTIYVQKSELDQFYTSEEVAKKCYNKICQMYNLDDFALVLEPSAGSGSFFKLFPIDKREGLDLDPKCDGVLKMDFFNRKFRCSTTKIRNVRDDGFGNF